MKKFNTILAIVAVALASVFGFTSCDKNDDSINNAVTPVQPKQEQKAQDKATQETEKAPEFVDAFANMAGTWETTDSEGTKLTLVLSNPQDAVLCTTFRVDGKTYKSQLMYDAKLTVGDKTYESFFANGVFATLNDYVDGEPIYVIDVTPYLESMKANSLNIDIKVKNVITVEGTVLTKVN